MADGFTPIPAVIPGGVSLVSADYANKIIVPLNAILGGKVAPIANVGSMKYAGGQFILDLTALDGRLRAVEDALLTVEGRINNVIVISNSAYTVENFATYVVDRFANANITANGTCTGTNIEINISLNI